MKIERMATAEILRRSATTWYTGVRQTSYYAAIFFPDGQNFSITLPLVDLINYRDQFVKEPGLLWQNHFDQMARLYTLRKLMAQRNVQYALFKHFK